MCLLIAGKSSQIRNALLDTEGLLANIFKRNKDGVGAMYTTTKRKLRTPKVLPKTVEECAAFIAQLPNDDRQLALHFRMQTHGDINLENCHPYTVIEGQIAMMHNGVLAQGNRADDTKSDTWHYIADVVRPMLTEAPKMFLNKAWLSLVEFDISRNNRFAIMDADGELSILNKHTGISHEGMWFSNTYAWDAGILIPAHRRPVTQNYGRNYGLGDTWGDDETVLEEYLALKYGKDKPTPKKKGRGKRGAEAQATVVGPTVEELVKAEVMSGDFSMFTPDDVWEALGQSEVSVIADMLWEAPAYTLMCAFQNDYFAPFEKEKLVMEASHQEKAIIDLLVSENIIAIRRFMMATPIGHEKVAQVMGWLGDWLGKPINAKADTVPMMSHAVGTNVIALGGNVAALDANGITEKAEAELQDELAVAQAMLDMGYAGGLVYNE